LKWKCFSQVLPGDSQRLLEGGWAGRVDRVPFDSLPCDWSLSCADFLLLLLLLLSYGDILSLLSASYTTTSLCTTSNLRPPSSPELCPSRQLQPYTHSRFYQSRLVPVVTYCMYLSSHKITPNHTFLKHIHCLGKNTSPSQGGRCDSNACWQEPTTGVRKAAPDVSAPTYHSCDKT